jgi:oligopeptide/dipeptide ABC transporter ATP-binding protein
VTAALEIEDLHVRFSTDDGTVHAVDAVSLSVERGQTVAVVGESGSGKSATMLASMRLLPGNASVSGRIAVAGTDVLALSDRELAAVRGEVIAMIFQDPLASLNPYFTIGSQLEEAVLAHSRVSADVAHRTGIEWLERVGIPAAGVRSGLYPHQLSGGMRQRVMIAMAMCCRPDILIADEPTTALDVSVQAQILELIKELQADYGMAVVLVTHDFGVVAGMADTVNVMYAGRVIESGTRDAVFSAPQHPYTWGLLASSAQTTRPDSNRLYSIPGIPPSLINRPNGCAFHPRCACRFEPCDKVVPPLEGHAGVHPAACLLELGERDNRRRELIGR